MIYNQIKASEDLIASLKNNIHNYVIRSGVLNSSKYMELQDDGKIYVMDESDGYEYTVTIKELMKETNIGRFMESGNFFAETPKM